MTAGYSGTPLARKLGLKAGQRVWFDAMPASVREEIAPAALGLVELDAPGKGMDGAHIFAARRTDLADRLTALRHEIAADGFIWASWPKKAAKVPTDITEDTIREVALPMGYVDIKVCAVDAVWSGLKLVIRRELR